jgi:hypothetical protein
VSASRSAGLTRSEYPGGNTICAFPSVVNVWCSAMLRAVDRYTTVSGVEYHHGLICTANNAAKSANHRPGRRVQSVSQSSRP